MDITDTSSVIDALNRAAGASETWRIETYTMQRESKKHGWQEVTVRILDRGPDISPRYAVSATTPDGLQCSGNSGDDLNTTIAVVHWYELDQ